MPPPPKSWEANETAELQLGEKHEAAGKTQPAYCGSSLLTASSFSWDSKSGVVSTHWRTARACRRNMDDTYRPAAEEGEGLGVSVK